MSIVSRLRHNMSFATIPAAVFFDAPKRTVARSIVDRLTASGISLESVEFSGDGCCFVIDGRKGASFASVIREMHLEGAVRDRCASVTVTRTSTDLPLPSVARIMQALDDQHIDVVHFTSNLSALRMIVDEGDADHAAAVLSSFYRSGASLLPA